MTAWLDEKRDKLYCDIVCMVPFGFWARLIIDLGLKRFAVKHLKPTHCYRVYDMDCKPPRLVSAHPYRWAHWVAFKKAEFVSDLRQSRVAILACQTYISDDGQDRFPILRQMNPGEFHIIRDDTERTTDD